MERAVLKRLCLPDSVEPPGAEGEVPACATT